MSSAASIMVVGPHGPIVVQPGTPGPIEPDEPAGEVDVVELLPDYLPDGLGDEIQSIIAELEKCTIDIPLGSFGTGVDVNAARKRLAVFLRSSAFTAVRDELVGEDGPSLAHSMLTRTFDDASATVERIADADPGGMSAIDEDTIVTAVTRTETTYFKVTDPEEQAGHKATLDGYDGPRLTAEQQRGLARLSEFVVRGVERDIPLALLRAECLLGQRQFAAALAKYDELLAMVGLNAARKRFVAINASYVRLALADQAYRGVRRVDAAARKAVIPLYDRAVLLLVEHGVGRRDPDRLEIEGRVLRAKNQLNAGLNVLGLRDSFVPVQTFSLLFDLADGEIGNCVKTAEAFENDLARAEDELTKQFDLDAEIEAEETTLEISALQVDNATLTGQQEKEKVEQIEAQRDFLVAETAIAGSGKLVEAAVTAGFGTPDPNQPVRGASGVVGVIGTVVDFFAQNNELGHQLEIAKLQQQIAANQASIAVLQQQLSANRLAHLQRKAAFLDHKRMNADFLYARAAIRERRAERQLEVAIFLAYLYERALAFFLGQPELERHIRFDYLDTQPGIAAAADQLADDFATVKRELGDLDLPQQGSGFTMELSLLENYPLQFQQFLASDDGRMDFVYSLYQLSKDRPATHHCRLYHVGVEVRGLVAGGELRGTLSHAGRFLVRDRDSTLNPPAARLVPTDEQLCAALQEQQQQGTAVAAVEGVLIYALPVPQVLDLSTQSEFVPPPPPQELTLKTFEGHAPTGLWSLQIEAHRALDITDIVLHFGIVNRRSDPDDLRDHVVDLVREYELELAEGDGLDRVDGFSLRQQFPDAFFALENGAATFELEAELFNPDLTDLQFKAVVVQAVDDEDDGVAGIEVEVRRDEFGFSRRRTTGAGGFSEDLDAPLEVLGREDRFPLLGSWQVSLPQPAQFGQLGDLRVFVMYAYTQT